ncbi:hypothetical protein BU24DRAFT_130901 [Aaosphaeria arxii CBS 175.79]|uniref:Zn(2)-C6 fungal-type domain-containing protein n=1 Tax=Aaosphaeria arxii CBS 175.79 TaxID=1450172 RepID=A0A6A5Y3W2_9PLEO|nr:uncharacterized protein BU24DRAFT_130901 [Aaosphaeria arxii CBS 175.79]KAF2019969.1 hypothetical protein BU24DRAFT_130901 [Aaosphaeria arxii CBS 175.79]
MQRPSGDSAETPSSRRGRRINAACKACHARKVRCSLAQTGSPCMNCTLDRLQCEPRVAKRRSQRNELPAAPPQRQRDEPQSASVLPTAPRADSHNQISPPSESTQERQNLSEAVPTPLDAEREEQRTPYRPFAEHFSHHPGQSGSSPFPLDDDASEHRCSPVYGDPHGVGLVADICEPGRKEKSGHFLVPQIKSSHIDPQTIDFLRLRGAFDLPVLEVCDMLIQAYFHHVHPFFPVVEPRGFLEKFHSEHRFEISTHLLWSMFLAAANFADSKTLKTAQFPSRKEMKRSMYTKAKALYDAEYERDKVTLIQAVLLMGFWYADTEDRTGPWHWNGVAISLCQTIGLHRDPDSSLGHARSLSVYNRRLWRQLWWSCFYREAWFSAGMGRPMRIQLTDCSSTMPTVQDLEDRVAEISCTLREKYLPDDMRRLSMLWIHLLELTVALSNILLGQHRANRVLPTENEIEQIESQIRACFDKYSNIMRLGRQSRLVLLYAYHFEIYIESVSIILYRPFLLMNPTESFSQEWKSIVERKTRSAAASVNMSLSNMIGTDMINDCQSMICIALVPALQVHLLDYSSHKNMIHRMGSKHLEICMIVVEELKETFFGAEILYRMFSKAQKQILSRRIAALSETETAPNVDTMTPSNSIAPDMWTDVSVAPHQVHDDEFDTLSAIRRSYDGSMPFDFFADIGFDFNLLDT